jgi:hypothetical protein
MWICDWLPHLARHADDLAVIRSCRSDAIQHVGGLCLMNTGSVFGGRPSLGAWVTYGLGSAQLNLPTFVVMQDERDIVGGLQNYSSGFLPLTFGGTVLHRGNTPILNLKPPHGAHGLQQQSRIDFLKALNTMHARDYEGDAEFNERMRSYELAYEMQATAPDAVDLTKETLATKKLYGIDEPETSTFGTNCLLARRLVERGVRFVELYNGSGSGWDAHHDLNGNHSKRCRSFDIPIAGLLADLKSRGMLRDTLVVCGGEFGRTPFAQMKSGTPRADFGRDHNPWGYTIWMAGGGVKGGKAIGATDELGLRAVEEPCDVHDIHASILYLLGLDHLRTTYTHNGRAERPTGTGGNLISTLWT